MYEMFSTFSHHFSLSKTISYFCIVINIKYIMTTALLNIRLDYDQVLALVQQLSDEDKLRLKDELIAETAKKNNSYIKDLSITEETELISTKEIQDESIIRKELYEVRPITVCQEKLASSHRSFAIVTLLTP